MQISELSLAFTKLEKTSSRNAITLILADLLKSSKPEEIDKLCYLALGELVPAYRGLELKIAEKMLIQILATAYNVPAERILKQFKATGDLGNVAYENSKTHQPGRQDSKLSVTDVYDTLIAAAKESGTGSQERKIRMLAKLLKELDPLSSKFITRIPAGKLRLGFSDATILDALSIMVKGDKSARALIERAYNVTADIGRIARLLKSGGIGALAKIKPQPGIPIRPSLAERLPDPQEIIEKLGPSVAVEPKLDGLRTALHVWQENGKKEVRLFSRNLENTTAMFPEITAAALKLKAASVILDGEAIGYDPATGKFAPFQETVRRKRKYEIAEFARKLPFAIFIFDILYLNGDSLLDQPFRKRREVLEKLIPEKLGAIHLVKQRLASKSEEITEELEKAVKAGLEGVVIKNLQSPYEAGSRGFHWVKFKPTSAALTEIRAGKYKGLADTIDCLLMGAYKGRGKRARFGFGGFLLGVRGKDGKFYTISRLGSGLSDADFKKMAALVKRIAVGEKPNAYVVNKETVPDIWVRPEIVLEILADEITLSPRHTAGMKKDRGYSLRFPRLVRLRNDKNPDDATSVEEVARFYRLQRKS